MRESIAGERHGTRLNIEINYYAVVGIDEGESGMR